jgi:hypothetical protein
MMEETDDLAFYLQSNKDGALFDVQNWIKDQMDTIHGSKGVKNCILLHVFNALDKQGNKHSAQYSHEYLYKFLERGYDEILLTGIQHGPSVAEVLKGWKPKPNTERGVIVVVNYGTLIGEMGDNSVGVNNGVIYYNEKETYNELKDLLTQFLENQKKSPDTSVKKEEITKIEDIINTQEPKEGKKKLIELITPYLPIVNTGATVTNLLMAMANFSNAHPALLTGIKTLFNFLTY